MTDCRVGRRKSDSSKWVVAVRVQKKKSVRNVLKERNKCGEVKEKEKVKTTPRI